MSRRLPGVGALLVGTMAAIIVAVLAVVAAAQLTDRDASDSRAAMQLARAQAVAATMIRPDVPPLPAGDELANAIGRAAGVDVVFVDTTTTGNPVVVGSSLPSGPDLLALAETFRGHRGQPVEPIDVTVEGLSYRATAATVLPEAGGVRVMVVLAPNTTDWIPPRTLLGAALIVILAAAALAVILSLQLSARVAGALSDMAGAARRAAKGDRTARVKDVPAGALRDLGQALQRLIDKVSAAPAAPPAGAEPARPSRPPPPPASATAINLAAISSSGMFPALRASDHTMAVGGPPEGTIDGANLVPGHVFAERYEILEVLGRSPVRTAYKVRDREQGELVTLKTLREDLFTGDTQAVEQFKADLRIARRLAHRNILRTFGFGEWGGIYYVTMEQIDATPLRVLLDRRKQLTPEETISIGSHILRGLEVAHADGVIHRDVRPESLLIDKQGVLRVADFGLASPAHQTRAHIKGMDRHTLAYLAPEVLSAQQIDARADLYSVGVVLMECLLGDVPFRSTEPEAMLAEKRRPLPPITEFNPNVPSALAAVIGKAVAPDPADRPAGAAEFRQMLLRAAAPTPG